MSLKFEEWLVAQNQRDDLIGDLARIPGLENTSRANGRSKPDEHKSWADIVVRIPQQDYSTVFNEAWQEFLLAKRAEDDLPK